MWEEKRPEGVTVRMREERKSKGKRRSERAIRVMHRAKERLFSNIFFFGKQPIENKAHFC